MQGTHDCVDRRQCVVSAIQAKEDLPGSGCAGDHSPVQILNRHIGLIYFDHALRVTISNISANK